VSEETTYRIGEAAEKLGLKPYVLRFWETEFPQLEPLRSEKGQRLYTDDHLELLARIQHLVHERGMTIEGARKELEEPSEEPCPVKTDVVQEVVIELEAIKFLMLSMPPAL
jgi:DNA-binding transcriptional MerR regulator